MRIMSLITRTCRSNPVRPSFIFKTQIKTPLFCPPYQTVVFPLFFQPLYKFLNVLPLFYCLSYDLTLLSNLSFFTFIFLLILNLIKLFCILNFFFLLSSLLFLSGCKIGLRSVCNTLEYHGQSCLQNRSCKNRSGLLQGGVDTKNGCSPPNDVRFL